MSITLQRTALLVAVTIAGCSSAPKFAEVGGAAPAFQLSRISSNGSVLTSDSLRGKPVVINFWSTTCAVCVGEIEDLNRLQTEHGLRVIGIALDEDADRVRELAAEKGIKYDLLMGTPEVFEQFDGYAIPHTVVISEDQIVRSMVVGRINPDDILNASGIQVTAAKEGLVSSVD